MRASRISNSLPIVVNWQMYCNATIKEAAQPPVAINFLLPFLLAYRVLTSMDAIRSNHCATHIWTLLAVPVTCLTSHPVDPFLHSVNCSLPIAYSNSLLFIFTFVIVTDFDNMQQF